MTGTYRFQTGFYGFTDMPAEFQKAMDYTLIGLENTYCFLDDILIVSKGSLIDHKNYVMKCLQRLDDKNLRINLPKCHFGIIYHKKVFRPSNLRPRQFWLSKQRKL